MIETQLPADFKLTPEFQTSFERMEGSDEHLFLTGKAGTGKSTLLQYFMEKTDKNVIVLAPTGCAAVNVGGATIHSFFQFPSQVLTKEDVKFLFKKQELFRNLDTIIIDEVSMVRADMMDAIDESLRINTGVTDKPFGGVQMILIGDLYQLPPVVENRLVKYFDEQFRSPFFFDAKAMAQVQLGRIELKEIHRQTDQDFIELLNKIRTKTLTNVDIFKLNRRCELNDEFKAEDLVVTLTGTRDLAARINQTKLKDLAGEEFYYRALIMGQFDDGSFPTDERLCLKKDAQIMMVRNDPRGRWVNGSLGKITHLDDDDIRVEIDGCEHKVDMMKWRKIDYRYANDELMFFEKGTFEQYPIRLAWAITVHKSQGQTFDKLTIDLGWGAFAPGQTYVALSRCRSLAGIKLRSRIKLSDVIFDDRILEFSNGEQIGDQPA